MNDLTITREIQTKTTEIRTITRQTQQVVLSAAIEIGRRLAEVKEMLPHGQWGAYLENEVEFSQSTANNFMRLYEEYGDKQQSLFAPNSQALENLSYTKALRLLALPAEERADFAEENDVESMSTRELEKALRERDEARAEAEKAKQRSEDLEQTVAAQADMLDTKDEAIENRDRLLRQAQEKAEAKAGKVAKLKEDLKKAKDAKEKADAALAASKENPEIPAELMERIRKESEASYAAMVQKDTEKKLAAAREQARKAEAARAEAEKKLDDARKAARIADPDLQAVQVLGQQLLSQWNTILGHRKKAVQNNADNEAPLNGFLKKLLETMGQVLG